MFSRWKWLALQLSRKLWIRATLFSILGVVTALVGPPLEAIFPAGLPDLVGADAVDQILNILASSLLAVTTFSLTVMVSAYSAATSNVTPRANQLLMQDTTTQNVLSAFIGAFLFSLVGIIALHAGAYGEGGRFILFIVTLGVVVVIVVALLRWIQHLSHLGRVRETTDRVEAVTLHSLAERVEHPHLGGRPREYVEELPQGAVPVLPDSTGYVLHLDMGRISERAEELEGEILVDTLPGSFVHPSRPLAWILAPGFAAMEEEERRKTGDRVRRCFTVGDQRSFDQDPRFGLSVLAEIASRALSPAVNDPGTAIDVIGRGVRILGKWPGDPHPASEEEVRWPRVRVPALSSDDLFDDLFAPIARDGAALMEVQLRLQKALLALSQGGDRTVRLAARRLSRNALQRAEGTLGIEEERARVRTVAEAVARSARGLET